MIPRYRPVTQSDVAKEAGVSASTVSRVIAGVEAGIPEATAERVRRVAAEMGYRRNAIAVGLKHRTTETIGFISDVIASTPHAGAMVQGAQDAAWEAGKVLLLVNTGGDPDVEERAILAMLDRQVDGLVYATMYHQHREVPEALRRVPSVLLDVRSPEIFLPSVTPDEQSGAEAAVRYLLELGHRRVAFVTSSAEIPASNERLLGYRAALTAAGIGIDEALVVADIDEFEGGARAAHRLLDLEMPPTAMFCFNDRMAAGAMRTARHRGLEVPRDLSVVGMDNEELVALMTDPPLTTFQLPHYEMGRWAVSALVSMDPGNYGVEHRIPFTLVARRSAAAPRA